MEESVITCCSQYIKGTKKTNHNRNTINNFFFGCCFCKPSQSMFAWDSFIVSLATMHEGRELFDFFRRFLYNDFLYHFFFVYLMKFDLESMSIKHLRRTCMRMGNG